MEGDGAPWSRTPALDPASLPPPRPCPRQGVFHGGELDLAGGRCRGVESGRQGPGQGRDSLQHGWRPIGRPYHHRGGEALSPPSSCHASDLPLPPLSLFLAGRRRGGGSNLSRGGRWGCAWRQSTARATTQEDVLAAHKEQERMRTRIFI